MMGGDMMGSSSSTKTLRCQACSTENILMMPALRCASIHHQHQQQPPSYSHPLQHSSCEDAVTSSDNVVVDDDALEDCRYDHRLQQQVLVYWHRRSDKMSIWRREGGKKSVKTLFLLFTSNTTHDPSKGHE